MNFRYIYSDIIKNKFYISPKNTSYKGFVNYDVIKGFFAYGEWEKSGIKKSKNDKSSKTWKDNYFIGIEKKFLVHPKLYLTVAALYTVPLIPAVALDHWMRAHHSYHNKKRTTQYR